MNFKSLACLTAALAAGTVLADYTVDIGFTKVVSDCKNTIVAVPYSGFTPGANITVADVVKTANLAEGDLCYVMNGDAYDVWQLTKGEGDVLNWIPTTQVNVDKNGNPSQVETGAASETLLTPGSALWIVRKQNVENSRDYSVPFYLWGRYTTDSVPSSTVTLGGWSLVANCGSVACSVNWLIGKLGAATKGDRIVIPNNGAGLNHACKNATTPTWTGDINTNMIQPGMGCWVYKQGTGDPITIEWTSED